MSDRVLEVVGIAGSLRKASFNRALLKALAEIAPAGLHITTHDLDSIPMYNGDAEAAGVPPPVAALREAVGKADGLLIATPEYNYGIPGVLKNTIDWLSRPPKPLVLSGKPTGILGATPGMWGTVRAQKQLREVFHGTNTPTMARPEMLISKAGEKFSADGTLTDDPTREFLKAFLAALALWIAQSRK